MFQPNTRVRYIGLTLASKAGASAVVCKPSEAIDPEVATIVRFDGETNKRVIYNINLQLENPKTMSNFKTTVDAALAKIDEGVALNAKDEAVRRLGVGKALASSGEKAVKSAKVALKGLGLLADAYPTGTEVLYDSDKFKLTAETKEPAQGLKVECLQAELTRRGYSGKVIADIIAASYGTNKPATTLIVEQKI